MSIEAVNALAVRVPRDVTAAYGTAGSPAPLGAAAGPRYRWAEANGTVYSDHLETVLISIHSNIGSVGWGEAQAPVAPEIICAVVDSLLGPLLIGEDACAPEAIWARMYSAMRVRGHTGGFLLDAMAGIDLAIWDLCGKAYDLPVSRLLGGPVRTTVPCYVSGLAGDSIDARVDEALGWARSGATAFKIFLSGSQSECLAELDALRTALGSGVLLAVDALWRLDLADAIRFATQLADRGVAWLEAPLKPEDVSGHMFLARSSPVTIAVGESYRTRFEVRPFLEQGGVGLLQPDLGRTGLTEGRKLGSLADTFHVRVAPHLSIGLGPQLAAALHFAAATTNLAMLELNPLVYELASQVMGTELIRGVTDLQAPAGPGLGIEVDVERILPYVVRRTRRPG